MAIIVGDSQEQIQECVARFFPDAVRKSYYEWIIDNVILYGISDNSWCTIHRDTPVLLISTNQDTRIRVAIRFDDIEYIDEHGNIVESK